VANRIVKKFAMKDMRELVGDLSQTNHYMVSFSTLNSTLMSYIQKRIGFQEDVRNFLSRKTGLLCSEASLPTSSFATGEVRDNFMGIPQEFAHTRLYTDIDFTFYVDTNYVNLKIFESWMDYIAGGSEAEISELNEDYYRRMRYPDTYKVQTMFISKFERDFNSQIDYQFINAFPKLVTAIPVSYGAADLLKVSVQFTYDRYIVNPRGSIRKSNTSGFNDIARVSNDTTATSTTLPSTGSAAADEYFKDNRNSLLNDPRGIPFDYDPTRLGFQNIDIPSKKVLERKPESGAQVTSLQVTPHQAPAITPEQQRGLDAASTESTRTGYVDPYKQMRKNQADREKFKNRPDLFF
jgi:hypothetical protein